MKKLFSFLLLLSFTIKAQEIKIGNQTWTTKNLDVTTYRNGDAIPQVQDKKAWANLITGAWCYHENKAANGTIYGKLYNWYAVNDPRGLAPKGYHIPTGEEWSIIIHEPEDFTKITGLEGGCRSGNGEFEYGNGFWWISEAGNTDNLNFMTKEPYDNYLYELEKYSDLSEMKNKNYLKHFGFSVRCIKD